MLWIKALHIVFIASWFAGLFYLPRIFVNLAMETNEIATARLLLMARKLYRFMTILAVPALVLGLWLWLGYGIGMASGWMHLKLALVLLLLGYHHVCGRMLKQFEGLLKLLNPYQTNPAYTPALSHPLNPPSGGWPQSHRPPA